METLFKRGVHFIPHVYSYRFSLINSSVVTTSDWIGFSVSGTNILFDVVTTSKWFGVSMSEMIM